MQARIDELLQERSTQSAAVVLSLEAELAHNCSALAQVTAPFPFLFMNRGSPSCIKISGFCKVLQDQVAPRSRYRGITSCRQQLLKSSCMCRRRSRMGREHRKRLLG